MLKINKHILCMFTLFAPIMAMAQDGGVPQNLSEAFTLCKQHIVTPPPRGPLRNTPSPYYETAWQQCIKIEALYYKFLGDIREQENQQKIQKRLDSVIQEHEGK